MPLRGFLEKALERADDESPNACTVFYECRYCGSTSEAPMEQYEICRSTGISIYTVNSGSSE